jgi:hypothetical protein
MFRVTVGCYEFFSLDQHFGFCSIFELCHALISFSSLTREIMCLVRIRPCIAACVQMKKLCWFVGLLHSLSRLHGQSTSRRPHLYLFEYTRYEFFISLIFLNLTADLLCNSLYGLDIARPAPKQSLLLENFTCWYVLAEMRVLYKRSEINCYDSQLNIQHFAYQFNAG